MSVSKTCVYNFVIMEELLSRDISHYEEINLGCKNHISYHRHVYDFM